MTTARDELKRGIQKQLDTSGFIIVDGQDFDFESTDEFVMLSLVSLASNDPNDNYLGIFQVDCISKLRDPFSLDKMVDTVKGLFLQTFLSNVPNYSVNIFGASEDQIDDNHLALTFDVKLYQ